MMKSLLAGAAIIALMTTTALADITLNRGSAADPESLDPHKTSTTYEADLLRDLFTGLMT